MKPMSQEDFIVGEKYKFVGFEGWLLKGDICILSEINDEGVYGFISDRSSVRIPVWFIDPTTSFEKVENTMEFRRQ